MNILGKRYLFFAISLVIILTGIAILTVKGIQKDMPLSIDFTGGSLLEVQFDPAASVENADIINLYGQQDIKDIQVQSTDLGTFVIRSSYLSDADRETVVTAMRAQFGAITIIRFDSVGPSIGKQVTSRAAIAVGIAALAILFYISWAFRKVQHAFRYGVCAIIAMLHDVAIVFAVVAIGSLLFGWEMDSLFLTALLTVIGFSVQDKIVVFDRVRENSNVLRKLEFEKLVNHSIVQTLQRSINTQLMTVEFLLLSLALFGGVTLREFCVILLVGLLSGTYSSIFIAAPLLILWENEEWKTWFHRKDKTILA